MKKITELIKERRVYLDGGFGTEVQALGLMPGEEPATWSLKHPDRITEIHRRYFKAGSDAVCANTFSVNRTKFDNYDELIKAAIKCARAAADEFDEQKYVALDMGPLGSLLEPLGPMKFEEAVSIYADNVRAAEGCGADFIFIETQNDAYETKAAVIAAKENSDLPILVSNAYDQSGRLMTGGNPLAMVATLEGLGVDAIGLNCSVGPDKMIDLIKEYRKYSSLPVIVKPNAGLPEVVNGETVFTFDAEKFSDLMIEIAEMPGTVLGGCCGTTPEHIRQLREKTKDIPYSFPEKKNYTMVSSYTHGVVIGEDPILIGERINPTGKKKLKEALKNNDMDYILNEGIRQADKGVQILDVNVGLPEIDETAVLVDAVKSLQGITDLPLQIDTSSAEAMEAAMRVYNGKPLVNSVNGKQHVMEEIFPLVQKYGGTVIALTIGEEGIPETAEGRLEIARNIIKTAAEYGIEKKDIIVDPLAMAVSASQDSAMVAIKVIEVLTAEGIRTSLGVSNISFGLPHREIINHVFFSNALQAGLSCAIMNPFTLQMMDVYYAFRALNCIDTNCLDYIEYASEREETVTAAAPAAQPAGQAGVPAAGDTGSALGKHILKGMSDSAGKTAGEMLGAGIDPLVIINEHIVPALDEIGKAFEEKRVYLPQLLMSADAASAAFEKVKEKLPASASDTGRSVILATVKGDIHDIGKNIVKVLLESYGFFVIDLGRDVDPETIRDCAVEKGCKVVGLSALMTTTVPAMEETIKLLKETGLDIKTVVGGAVLTQEYSDMIGADRYSPDAMDTVRFAEEYYRQ